MSKGQNDSIVNKSIVRLIYPENMKQLSFIVSKQWARQDFQGNSDNVKVKGQKIKITLQCTVPYDLICPETVAFYSFRAMAWTKCQGGSHILKTEG